MKNKSVFSLLFVLLSFSHLFGQNIYYLRSGLTPTNVNSWTTDPLGVLINPPSSFLTANTTWNMYNDLNFSNSVVTLSGNWDLGSSSNSTVNLGNGTDGITLDVNGASITLGGTNAEFNITNAATVSVTGSVTFPSSNMRPRIGSTFIFDSGSPMVPAFSGTNSSYKNLIVNSTNSLAASVVIQSTLTINSTFTLFINDKSLTVGAINGTGLLAASSTTALPSSTLIVNGKGGTMNIANGFGCISSMSLHLSGSGDELTLGSTSNSSFGGLTIHSGQLTLANGSMMMNGQDLLLSDLTGSGMNNAGGKVGGSLSRTTDIRIRNSPITGSVNIELPLLNSLTLNSSGSTLSIINSTNNPVQIYDSLSVLAGDLKVAGNVVIKTDDNLKGRLSRVGGTITGDVIVETLLYGGTTGWGLIAGPGISGATVAQWDTWTTAKPQDGLPMSCTGCQVDPTHFNPPWYSIYTWAEPTSTYVPATSSTSLTPGLGFWAYIGNGPSSTSNLTLKNQGAPIVGNYSVSVSNTSGAPTPSNQGFNLIANPYASPIGWSKVLSHNSNLDPTVYVWSGDNGAYASYNATGSVSTLGQGNRLPLGQGFYVRMNTVGSMSVSFVESDKSTGANHILKPSSSSTNAFKVRLAGPKGELDEMAFYFTTAASINYDQGYDSQKLYASPDNSKYTSIASRDLSGIDISINAIPPLYQNFSVPVVVKGMSNGTYTISAAEHKHLSNCLKLKDKALNVEHDLQTGDYVFQMNDTTSAPRFELLMCQDAKVNPVGIQKNPLENNVVIGQDAEGVFVNTLFDRSTKATISAYNVVGQKIMEDIHSVGTVNYRRLPIDVQNQIVIIKVTSDQGTVTKKIIKN